ncbi:MAG: hypothetical protein BGP25_02575 [Lysobacterales bacterium 63-13]|nr:MAG: hypothetical protein BGP25_02575 [Xanthomonadales bacterium 63-13]
MCRQYNADASTFSGGTRLRFEPLTLTRKVTHPSKDLGSDVVVPVAVISLADMTGRRDNLLLGNVPAAWVECYFPAVDMRRAERRECDGVTDCTRILADYGREFSPGEIGCALSHHLVYRQFLDSPHDLALVLEDDSLPCNNGIEQVAQLGASLLAAARDGKSFVCNIGLPELYTQDHIVRAVDLQSFAAEQVRLFEHVDPRFSLWRANAYLISRRAARNIVNREKRVSVLADDWSRRRAVGSVKHLLFPAKPFFFQDQTLGSTIEEGRSESHQTLAIPANSNPSIGERISHALLHRSRIAVARLKRLASLRLLL